MKEFFKFMLASMLGFILVIGIIFFISFGLLVGLMSFAKQKEVKTSENTVIRIEFKDPIPERTLKRRFKAATGATLIEYIQNLRIEEAKTLLETEQMPVDDISVAVSYEDASFFRRLFKRLTGLTPSQYRRMFKPVLNLNN